MAARKPPQPVNEPTMLKFPREDAASKLEKRIADGKTLLQRNVSNESEYAQLTDEYFSWEEYNQSLLKALFTDDTVVRQYRGIVMGGPDPRDPLAKRIESQRSDIKGEVRRLESISAQLENYGLAPTATVPASSQGTPQLHIGRKVFIVHGRDEAAKHSVARYVERLGFEAVILAEQVGGGLTIIEKLEAHGNPDFALVLITPDDVGALLGNEKDLKGRARQNVVLEFGYFVGKIGRQRVCALVKGPIERPSDMDGLLYVALDDAGGWRLSVAREMKQAGLSIDMNKAV